jgi:hypothetical protein
MIFVRSAKVMWNIPIKEDLAKLPPVYGTEQIKVQDKIVGMKFFLGSWTWYAVEYSPEEKLFFGFVDGQAGEWGYFGLQELQMIKAPLFPGGPKALEVDRDIYWNPCSVSEIPEISGRAY